MGVGKIRVDFFGTALSQSKIDSKSDGSANDVVPRDHALESFCLYLWFHHI